jgi:cytochrome c-type biogenesis protein CcmE
LARPSRLKPRHRRLLAVAAVLAVLAAIAGLVLNAFSSNLVFFYTPSQVLDHQAPAGRSFRVGGLVQPGSLRREGLQVHFLVSDGARQLPVQYQGALPDLFKEGKGVVAQGHLVQGRFVAREVLAKHDENYMPPEAAAALAQGGQPVQAPHSLRGRGQP